MARSAIVSPSLPAPALLGSISELPPYALWVALTNHDSEASRSAAPCIVHQQLHSESAYGTVSTHAIIDIHSRKEQHFHDSNLPPDTGGVVDLAAW